jgi:hypothetical protein
MFIWDFVADTVLGQILDWIYSQMIGFLGNFFAAMGNMGADLFDMTWVKSIVLFFTRSSMPREGASPSIASISFGKYSTVRLTGPIPPFSRSASS